MSNIKIAKNFQKFKKLEKETGLKTKITAEEIKDGSLDRAKLLPLAFFNKRETKKDVLSIKEVFGEDWRHNRTVLTEDAIEKFSPDNIDVNFFWKKSVNEYPFLSICGYGNVKDTNEANGATLPLHYAHKGVSAIQHFYELNPTDFKMLEIGPGYGNIRDLIKGIPNIGYYAIDVNPLFECDTLYKCDGKNIPSQIPTNLDLVYSINVFQHLSKAQRTSYYKQAYMILKDGGGLVFSMFTLTPKNFDKPYWHISDNSGRFYCTFFNQFTPIDFIGDVKDELEEIGFEFHLLHEQENSCSFLAIKKAV
jgi:predicted SAM-dependent methyltransferase